MIDRYVHTWIATCSGYTKAQTAFELHLLLSALENEKLRRKLAEMLEAEIGQLAQLLENRVIDPARPSDRTTPQQAMAIAKAMKAILTGFGLREPFMADIPDLVYPILPGSPAWRSRRWSRRHRARPPGTKTMQGRLGVRSPWSWRPCQYREILKLKALGGTLPCWLPARSVGSRGVDRRRALGSLPPPLSPTLLSLWAVPSLTPMPGSRQHLPGRSSPPPSSSAARLALS